MVQHHRADDRIVLLGDEELARADGIAQKIRRRIDILLPSRADRAVPDAVDDGVLEGSDRLKL